MDQMEIYLWQDSLDKNQYWIGSKNHGTYCGWLPVFVDAILECFGEDAYRKALAMKPGESKRINLAMTFAV